MAYMFNNWPTVSYDLKKNGKPLELTNITARFKINELILNKSAVMYEYNVCLLYTSPSPRDGLLSRMPSSA